MKQKTFILSIVLLAFLATSCEKEFIEDSMAPESSALKSMHADNNNLKHFDDWGFNWNAHLFKGYLVNAILADHAFMGMAHYKQAVYNGEGMEFWNDLVSTYPQVAWFMHPFLLDCHLTMHWNEALCSKDGEYPDAWTDTDAWITFKFRGNNGGEDWSHFRKLVAVNSSDELLEDGIWYNAAGEQIGLQSDWAELMIIQVVNNGNVPPVFYDTYRGPFNSGLGAMK